MTDPTERLLLLLLAIAFVYCVIALACWAMRRRRERRYERLTAAIRARYEARRDEGGTC